MHTARFKAGQTAGNAGAPPNPTHPKAALKKPGLVLAAILAAFLLLQSCLPLSTTIKIGADEGFELAKATLCVNGYHLYTQIWNDQPPLHTFLVTQILQHVSTSVLAPRLLTVAFSVLLLAAVFVAALRVHGLGVAAFATAWVAASPGFLELSCSVMQEIPALAPALAALAILLTGSGGKSRVPEAAAGVLLAIALQMKLIEIIYLPLAGLILFLGHRPAAVRETPRRTRGQSAGGPGPTGAGVKQFAGPAFVFAVALAATFGLLSLLLGRDFWLHFQQSWAAHFAPPLTLEYGSPSEHAFDWSVLLKNWDTTPFALAGVVFCVHRRRQTPLGLVPVVWLILTLAIFGYHKPWWAYYYVHNAVPLCWCGAVGFVGIYGFVKRRSAGGRALFFALAAGASIWMGCRLYLEVTGIRHSPQIPSSLVLQKIQRLKPFTQFIYTDEPVYSFHSGIPLPPELGVVSLKRYWSGSLTDDRLAEVMAGTRPGLVLWRTGTTALPFDDLLHAEYRLIYEDSERRLYARAEVLQRAKQSHPGE
jgi:hypothetical protein